MNSYLILNIKQSKISLKKRWTYISLNRYVEDQFNISRIHKV